MLRRLAGFELIAALLAAAALSFPSNASSGTVPTGFTDSFVASVPSPACCHNGGDLHFGKDSYLYVSVGDGGSGGRDQSILLGKVLRITRDGDIPSDNPFLGADSARCNLTGSTASGQICQETFAWG